jgi:hypothetical protein
MPASQPDDLDEELVSNNKNVFNENKNVFITRCTVRGGFAFVGRKGSGNESRKTLAQLKKSTRRGWFPRAVLCPRNASDEDRFL